MHAKTQDMTGPPSKYQLTAGDTEAIVALVRASTLAEAGNRLGVDASTVFRSIQRIEKGLGQRLFERSRVGYQPNELALQLARHGERIEAELEAARLAAQGSDGAVSGSVRITTTDTILHGLVMPSLRRLVTAHPLLRFDINTTNELASLTKRDADIAVRATKRPPSHLIGKQVGSIRVAVFAPKDHVGKPGKGIDVSDPNNCAWLAPDDALPEHPSVLWRKRHFPKAVAQYKVNSIHSVAAGIANGMGIGVIPLFLGLTMDSVVQVSEALDECETPLWLLTHPESRHLRRISTVFSHLADTMRLV